MLENECREGTYQTSPPRPSHSGLAQWQHHPFWSSPLGSTTTQGHTRELSLWSPRALAQRGGRQEYSPTPRASPTTIAARFIEAVRVICGPCLMANLVKLRRLSVGRQSMHKTHQELPRLSSPVDFQKDMRPASRQHPTYPYHDTVGSGCFPFSPTTHPPCAPIIAPLHPDAFPAPLR